MSGQSRSDTGLVTVNTGQTITFNTPTQDRMGPAGLPTFIDWRGNPIQVGDTVLYPPPSHAELYECVVIDLYQKYRDGSTKGWTRVTPTVPAPDGAEVEWRAFLQAVRRARSFPLEPDRFFRVTWTGNLTLVARGGETQHDQNEDRGTA